MNTNKELSNQTINSAPTGKEAMKWVNQIKECLGNQEKDGLYQAVKELQELSYIAKVENPHIIFDNLLNILASREAEWMDTRIKREIAAISSCFLYRVFVDDKNNAWFVSEATQKEWAEKIRNQIKEVLKNEKGWYVLYAVLQVLEEVVLESKHASIQEKAIILILQYETYEEKSSVPFTEIDDWRIRDKVAKACTVILAADAVQEYSLIARCKEAFIRMKIREKNQKVRQTLDNPKYITEIKAKLQKNWKEDYSAAAIILVEQEMLIELQKQILEEIRKTGDEKKIEFEIKKLEEKLNTYNEMTNNFNNICKELGFVMERLDAMKATMESNQQYLVSLSPPKQISDEGKRTTLLYSISRNYSLPIEGTSITGAKLSDIKTANSLSEIKP